MDPLFLLLIQCLSSGPSIFIFVLPSNASLYVELVVILLFVLSGQLVVGLGSFCSRMGVWVVSGMLMVVSHASWLLQWFIWLDTSGSGTWGCLNPAETVTSFPMALFAIALDDVAPSEGGPCSRLANLCYYCLVRY